jgi:hypothetical protein
MPFIVRNIDFCEKRRFLQKWHFKSIFRKKYQFSRQMPIFTKTPIFAKGFGEFRGNPIGFLQKSCFSTQKPIFAKNILQTFLQCPPHYPHGVRGLNTTF